MSKRILICGRGISLKHIEHESLNQKYDYVILMNEFNEFVKKDEKLYRFLKDKKIIQFLNITEFGLDLDFLSKFDIDKIYVTRLKQNGSSKWWREPRHHRKPEQYGRECNHPSDKLEEYMDITSHTGDIVLLFSILDLEATDVDFIGLDFYESDYHLNSAGPDYVSWKQTGRNKEITNNIKTAQKKIISIFKDVNFNYITNSTFNPELKNCKVINF